MLRSIRSIYLFVLDVGASAQWYSRAFALPIESLDESFASIRVGEILLCFHKADQKSPLSTGGSVVYWWTDDFEESLASMLEVGGELYRGPVPSEEGEQICQIKDPFGNILGLEGPVKVSVKPSSREEPHESNE